MVAAVEHDLAEDVGSRAAKQLSGGGLILDDASERFRRRIREGAQSLQTLFRKGCSRLERHLRPYRMHRAASFQPGEPDMLGPGHVRVEPRRLRALGSSDVDAGDCGQSL